MPLSRRGFLKKAMALTAAGILLPEAVAAEPERRVWPGWSAGPTLPMMKGDLTFWPDGTSAIFGHPGLQAGDVIQVDEEIIWISESLDPRFGPFTVHRGAAGTTMAPHAPDARIEVIGIALSGGQDYAANGNRRPMS
jgi:hypothetical protein